MPPKQPRMKQETRIVPSNDDPDVPEFIARLRKAAKGLQGAYVELEVEEGRYGDMDTVMVWVKGMRPLTAKEVKDEADAKAREEHYRETHERKQLGVLLKRYGEKGAL